MKKILTAFAVLLVCFSLFADDAVEEPVKNSESTETAETTEPQPLSFTEEPLEEEVVEDEAFLELLKTALLPEITPINIIEEKHTHTPLSFISDEEIEKPQVEAFRKMYLSPKWSALLRGYLESAMEYRLYVRKAVSDKQMPEMLEYLPVVESNYKTNAKSRSGAIGMWQFMANSVWPFLTLNDFVDERLDPWKSTDAALKKLTDNYNTFNDWLLAIGAYNCGVGAMNRAIKKAGGVKDFWYLAEHGYLSKQTADYVPKLIAIADLAINSQYYGIDIPDHKEEYEILENEKNGNFDYVTVKKAYSLNQLAQEMRMDAATIKRLNPSYTLGMTHPSKVSEIRLPLGMKESAEDALANMKPVDFPLKYTVVAGDSLWSISRKYKTTVSAICELNGIKENAILKIGKILYIPSK
ncbi:membrane-bound lytic murein transglycosylase D [Treponema bryantii]|uniref:Membrane-bound lytic murein transglycosylase D n=1 Tax=Treponema bryantii TaxID=163 RepID=A0A1H9ESQ2_9SPIR|nr:lytic transglycosylase domain-containing protein [Treponema bryantii]SEQ28665.1 membrane-bound lytic murein transglycosylase D [Treponema bryantii]